MMRRGYNVAGAQPKAVPAVFKTHRRIVVPLSGGLDSACLAAIALRAGCEVLPLFFCYGQRHLVREMEASAAVAYALGLDMVYSTMSLGDVFLRSTSPLVRKGTDLPSASEEKGGHRPAVEVPLRNAVLLSAAASYAMQMEATGVAMAAHYTAEGGGTFADGGQAFLVPMSEAVWRGSDGAVTLLLPFVAATKGTLLRHGLAAGAPVEFTWSCYEGHGSTPCGKCLTCFKRAEAFAEVGIADPALNTTKED